jgi:hypothetical protein
VDDPKIKFHLKLEGVISGAIMEKNTTKRIGSKHKQKGITISTMMMTKSSQVSIYKSTTIFHGSSNRSWDTTLRKCEVQIEK